MNKPNQDRNDRGVAAALGEVAKLLDPTFEGYVAVQFRVQGDEILTRVVAWTAEDETVAGMCEALHAQINAIVDDLHEAAHNIERRNAGVH